MFVVSVLSKISLHFPIPEQDFIGGKLKARLHFSLHSWHLRDLDVQ